MCWSRLLLTPIYKRWIVKPKKKKHRELLVLVCILDSFRFWEDSIYLVRMQRQEGRMEDLLREPSKIDLSQYPFFRESLKFGHSFFKGLRPSGRGVNEIIMKVGLSLVESSKMEELDERWKMQWMEEAELFLERNNLMREQTKLILDAISNNNNLSVWIQIIAFTFHLSFFFLPAQPFSF